MMMTAPVVFFDAGHTLVYPARPVGEIYAEVARHYGVRPDPDVLEAGFRRAWKKAKACGGSDRAGSKEWWYQLVRAAWADIDVPEHFPFHDYFEEVFRAFAHPGLWRVYADVWSALEKLQRADVRLGVLSNWDHRLHPILRGHELGAFFSSIVVSEEVGHAKPELEIFRAAEEAIQEKRRFVLVGDDLELDGDGAHRAGWDFFQVDRPETDLTDIASEILSRL